MKDVTPHSKTLRYLVRRYTTLKDVWHYVERRYITLKDVTLRYTIRYKTLHYVERRYTTLWHKRKIYDFPCYTGCFLTNMLANDLFSPLQQKKIIFELTQCQENMHQRYKVHLYLCFCYLHASKPYNNKRKETIMKFDGIVFYKLTVSCVLACCDWSVTMFIYQAISKHGCDVTPSPSLNL